MQLPFLPGDVLLPACPGQLPSHAGVGMCKCRSPPNQLNLPCSHLAWAPHCLDECFELQNYPFDSQPLRIQLRSTGTMALQDFEFVHGALFEDHERATGEPPRRVWKTLRDLG